jgi:hypothetical protein
MPNGMSTARVESPKRRSVIFLNLEHSYVRLVRVVVHKDTEDKDLNSYHYGLFCS